MVLTGRAALVALLCLLPIAVSPWPATSFAALLAALAVAVVVDVLLAPRPSGVELTRSGGTSARLGETVGLAMGVHNPTGRRLRGSVRDAWPPSARAQPRHHHIDVRAHGSTLLETTLHPLRRGELRSAATTVRTLGPLGLAGRQRTRRIAWSVRILPAFLSRKHLPSRLARLREIDGLLPVLIRGHGTEFDSLREYVESVRRARLHNLLLQMQRRPQLPGIATTPY